MQLEMIVKSAKKRGEEKDVGANPTLRTLFWKVAKLMRLPVVLLFVFDGRERPAIKRNSMKGKSGSHERSKDFKTLLTIWGIEWREVSGYHLLHVLLKSDELYLKARGEAEAELAYLNRAGHIDAVMTDDVDALLFGAITVIKKCVP